jgi:hypothetical protein
MAGSGPFDAIAAVALFASRTTEEGRTTSATDGPSGGGDVLGSRGASFPVPRVAQLSPIAPLEDADEGGPPLGLIAALLAATLALGVLALRLRGGRQASDGTPPAPAESDPRHWEPPPPPWSRD